MTMNAPFAPADWFTPPRRRAFQVLPGQGDPSWLGRLGRWVARRRIGVLLAAAAVLAGLAPLAAGVASHLRNGGFTAPAADSTRADAVLADRFHGGAPNLVLVVGVPGSVDDPAAVSAGRALAVQVGRDPAVLAVTSYWSTQAAGAAPLRSTDGRRALVLVRLAGDEDEVRQAAKRLVPQVAGQRGGLDVRATGTAQVSVEIERRSEADLRRAEALTLPVTLLILVLVFGSAVAATLPLVIGGLSVLGTYAALRVVTFFTPVSIFSLNITTALGLGLAIDYSLFMVTRYREELTRRRWVGRYGPPAARCCSPRSPWRCRCPPCWCSRCTSCARSPTPASPWCCSPRLSRCSYCPRCWRCSGGGWTRWTCAGRCAGCSAAPRRPPPPRSPRSGVGS